MASCSRICSTFGESCRLLLLLLEVELLAKSLEIP